MDFILPADCTVEDVRNATKEQLWYSFYHGEGYSNDVIREMSLYLCLIGL